MASRAGKRSSSRRRGAPRQPAVRAGLADRLLARLLEPVDIASLVFFRIAFGALMVWQTWIYLGSVEAQILAPEFHFTYLGFDWVRPWPGDGMYVHLYGMGLLAVFMMVGFWYRWSAVLFFLAHTYVFLIDQVLYQNHYYLVVLVSFLMTLVPAHRSFSVDAWRRGPAWRSATAPAWALWTLRAQMGLVYFFAGVAKLNADWLHGYPTHQSLPALAHWPIVGPYTSELWLAVLVSWAGMLLDLFIVPALLWRKTRPFAFAAALLFHSINKLWFGIGIFPGLSIAMTLLFFGPDWPRRLLRLPRPAKSERPTRLRPGPRQRLALAVCGVFLAIQVLLPLRRFFYDGNVSWTEEGHRFAWLQKVRGKQGILHFVVIDPATGRSWAVDPADYLTERQLEVMSWQPYMILQLAHHVADLATQPGRPRVQVLVTALSSLNGRELQPLIDSTVDLAGQPRTFFTPYDWIVPLGVPLGVPLEAQWDYKSPPTHPVAVALIERDRERFQAKMRALRGGAQARRSPER